MSSSTGATQPSEPPPRLNEEADVSAPLLTSEEPEDRPLVLPSALATASWTSTLARRSLRTQGLSFWQMPVHPGGPAPHLVPLRPQMQCNGKGEIYEIGSIAKEHSALQRVSTAPSLHSSKERKTAGIRG
eukprot:s10351_g2.t1